MRQKINLHAAEMHELNPISETLGAREASLGKKIRNVSFAGECEG